MNAYNIFTFFFSFFFDFFFLLSSSIFKQSKRSVDWHRKCNETKIYFFFFRNLLVADAQDENLVPFYCFGRKLEKIENRFQFFSLRCKQFFARNANKIISMVFVGFQNINLNGINFIYSTRNPLSTHSSFASRWMAIELAFGKIEKDEAKRESALRAVN